ncbi:DJC24 protein, partial [Neodrepanis coruscans]|nr:DJC24 protein [Neodrepanis coruscans]
MALEGNARKDWYKVLGAEPSDTAAELRHKYQKLALMYHPDKQEADVPAAEVEERVQRFMEIDQAWKILGNEETKKEYDLQQRG